MVSAVKDAFDEATVVPCRFVVRCMPVSFSCASVAVFASVRQGCLVAVVGTSFVVCSLLFRLKIMCFRFPGYHYRRMKTCCCSAAGVERSWCGFLKRRYRFLLLVYFVAC